MKLRTGAVVFVIAFGVSLAYYVSSKMPTDSINLVVGLACGVAATLPLSLGLLVALTRQRDTSVDEREDAPLPTTAAYWPGRHQFPHLIVLAPPYAQYQPGSAPYGYPSANHALGESSDLVEGRDWRIIGDDA